MAAFLPGATATDDLVNDNSAIDNPGGCGIIVVDHIGNGPARGTFNNVIENNFLSGNGFVNAGFGGGAGVAASSVHERRHL